MLATSGSAGRPERGPPEAAPPGPQPAEARQPEAEQPVAEPLVVVHDVEVPGARRQRPPHPDTERERLGGRAAPHHDRLEHVGPVPVLIPVRRPERVRLPVQVQAGYAGQLRAWVELGIRLPGEHFDPVTERVEFAAQMTDVDTL